jgi:hypothetical protein
MADMGDAIEILKRAQAKAPKPQKPVAMASAMSLDKKAPVYTLKAKNGVVVKMMGDGKPAPGKSIIS